MNKKVEEMRRTLYFSYWKEKTRSAVLCCKIKLRQLKGVEVDVDLIESRKQRVEMDDVIITSISKAKEWAEMA